MTRTVITIDVDHHPATKALVRILQLIDFCKDSYGVTTLNYTIEERD